MIYLTFPVYVAAALICLLDQFRLELDLTSLCNKYKLSNLLTKILHVIYSKYQKITTWRLSKNISLNLRPIIWTENWMTADQLNVGWGQETSKTLSLKYNDEPCLLYMAIISLKWGLMHPQSTPPEYSRHSVVTRSSHAPLVVTIDMQQSDIADLYMCNCTRYQWQQHAKIFILLYIIIIDMPYVVAGKLPFLWR